MTNIIAQDIKEIINNNSFWDEISGKTILITGASGMLPAYIVEVLLNLKKYIGIECKVICIVRNIHTAKQRFSSYENNSNIKILKLNLDDELVIQDDIHYIIHAASQASPKYYGIDPIGTLSTNIFGTKNLLDLAIKKKCEKFFFFSSSEVYGNVDSKLMPISETTFGSLDPMNVRSCYAESKRMGETLCISYAKQHSLNVFIARPFHTYGPGLKLDDGRVFADFVNAIVNNQDIQINSDGSATRAFCYIKDATEGFFYILFKGEPCEAYNVGTEKETSIKTLAEILITLHPEKKLKINFSHNPSSYINSSVSRNFPNIAKIKNLGWSPKTSISDGFSRTIMYYQNLRGYNV